MPVRAITTKETWRYWPQALATGPGGQPVDWTSPDFDDSGWPAGPAPIGYNIGGLQTTIPTQPPHPTD